MLLFPAIDLKDGRVVRLKRGDYDQVTRYEIAPEQAAADFEASGASCLHMVDLNGAKGGAAVNFDAIARIAGRTRLFLQVGGGIRDEQRIRAYLDAGVSRVILGTAAVRDFDFLVRMTGKYGEKIAVGVDMSGGMVAVDGWTQVTALSGTAFCARVRDAGVQTVICTDIAKDGMLGGTNLDLYQTLSKLGGLNVIASGGVTTPEDLAALRRMNLYGAIVGRALYDGRMTVAQALAACRAEG